MTLESLWTEQHAPPDWQNLVQGLLRQHKAMYPPFPECPFLGIQDFITPNNERGVLEGPVATEYWMHSRIITPAPMAGRIGLNATDREFVKRASNTDLQKAVALLTTAVKASAYCLENLEPPENERARGLWDRYRDSLSLTRRNVEAVSGRQNGELQGCVGVPTTRNIPDDSKFIAKVNLSDMAPSNNGTSAYPDPILVAYKSSVNWTRLWQFQLIAEAEPTDPEYYHVPSNSGAGSDAGSRSEHSSPDEVLVS